MNYKAITTLKKADTEGRIPPHTLDQYVRSDLAAQLMKALTPTLAINRVASGSSSTSLTNPLTVDFTTELFILGSSQWQKVKASLGASAASLSTDQQQFVRQLIDEIETTHLNAPSSS